MRAGHLFGVTLASVLTACGGDSSSNSAGQYDVTSLGSYQDYQVTPTSGGASYNRRIQVVATAPGGFTRRSTTSNVTTYTQNTLVVVDGSEYVATTTTHDAADGAITSSVANTPPYLLLSADHAPGTTETTVYTASDGTTTIQTTRSVTVDGVESVTVPAGTFSALRTTARITSSNGGDSYIVNWWARGIGRVKIAAYPASNPASVTTHVLTGRGG